MRIIFIILALLVGVFIAVMAMFNNEIVTLNYIFNEASLSLSALILGSAIAGGLVIILYNIFYRIHKYANSKDDRGYKNEIQKCLKSLEDENKQLKEELSKQQKNQEEDTAKELASLATKNIKLEEKLEKQQKSRENI